MSATYLLIKMLLKFKCSSIAMCFLVRVHVTGLTVETYVYILLKWEKNF